MNVVIKLFEPDLTLFYSDIDPNLISKYCLDTFPDFDVVYEEPTRTFWCSLRQQGAPRFTEDLMRQISTMQAFVSKASVSKNHSPVLFCVSMSQIPNVYSFGGDLPFFVESVRNGDREALLRYAQACVDLVYSNSTGWNSSALTVALVQGDALGGGFEAAISHNIVVAERSAKMGMPEILFNSFPGMGAFSFLTRKLDAARAERMILSGKVYTAGEMFDMGLVDVLADDGKGVDEVRRFVGDRRRYEVLLSMRKIRQRINPLTLEELRDVTEIWVDNAMKIHPQDLRKMERLVSAQERRLALTVAAPKQ